jgi:hypothetical protein
MFRSSNELPGLVPVLSRGKHRSARKGACFMEFASYLAGERWSDHPSCTHPLLSELARLVNDHTSDTYRPRLVELIPRVIGLTSDDVAVDARIALRSAKVALPVVSARRQNVMAVAILTADRILAEVDEEAARISKHESRRVLEQVPHAAQWAVRFAGSQASTQQGFRRHGAPNIVRCAVQGIAEACIPNADELLHDLLRDAIGDCEAVCRRTPAVSSPDATVPAAV